ncbi:hypothetical protein BJF93_13365 [Xaviernesmea oryzae]|uniref:Uncharacterized protein n=1 Tax=Xaviernesmea oryzae TaxID=464029 RepID=A0A1Q9AQZ2_9HYPH|nr:hypothetical protein [Xaviernesmea oryzae]OLP57834.1 hypothetical protein BJF93_13365 [Xaviernesmea oryzae]SEL34856.1 hypothetical protein SAMN04487976_107193 [Xaviernesmea oryzae]
MVGSKAKARPSYSGSSKARHSKTVATTKTDESTLAWQRENRCGPDYDPDYFDKLEGYFEEELGPLGDFKPVAA